MASEESAAEAIKVEPKPRQSEYVQMKRDDYKRIKNNFSILKAKLMKLQQQNLSLQNLYSVLSVKDEELKTFKSKAHKYETDYMRAQAQLSNLALKIGRDNGGQRVDFSAIIKSIEDDSQQSKDSGLYLGSIPRIVEDENKAEPKNNDKSASSISEEKRLSGGSDVDIDGISLSDSYFNKIIQENSNLKDKLKSYETNKESWAKFQAQEEQVQLVEELRLEVARLQVQGTELRLLLTAKQNDNVDALTHKLDQNITKARKLEKQLASKHNMLSAMEKEFRRLKVENEKLSRAGPQGAVGGRDEDDGQTSIRESIDVGYESCDTGVVKELYDKLASLQLEKGVLEKKIESIEEVNERHVTRLTNQIDALTKENAASQDTITMMQEIIRKEQDLPPQSRDTDQPITRAVMQEEVTRLNERIQLYEQEQRAEKEKCSILEGQMRNVQHELERRTEEVQRLREGEARLREGGARLQEAEARLQEALERKAHSQAELQHDNEQLRIHVDKKEAQIAQLNQKNSELFRKLNDYELASRSAMSRGPAYTTHHTPTNIVARHAPQQRGLLACDGDSGPPFPGPPKSDSDDSGPQSYGRHSLGPQSEPYTPLYHSDVRSSSSGHQSVGYPYEPQSATIPLRPRFEVADDGSAPAQQTGGVFVCERCLREFESHEEFKYKQHIKKCQD